MIINTTFHVAPEAEAGFKKWVLDTYIPYATDDCGLSAPLFMRRLADMEGGTGYAVQLRSASVQATEQWLECQQPVKLAEMASMWADKVMYFTTVMEEVAP